MKIIQNILFKDNLGQYIKNLEVKKFNITKGNSQQVVNDKYEVLTKKCFPRPRERVHVRVVIEKPKVPWRMAISIFKAFIPDTDDLFDQCFQFDWKCMKKPKFANEEEELDVRAALSEGYRYVKEAYKFFSALGTGTSGSAFAIPLNSFHDFMKQINLVDGKVIKFAENDLLFYQMNKTGGEATFLNPGVALIRYQFLEILLRLAIKRYLDTNTAKSIAESVRMLYAYNLKPTYGHFASQAFRDMKFWNEEIDNFFKVHLDIIDHLYMTYGGKKMLPGEEFFMRVNEFEHILQ